MCTNWFIRNEADVSADRKDSYEGQGGDEK